MKKRLTMLIMQQLKFCLLAHQRSSLRKLALRLKFFPGTRGKRLSSKNSRLKFHHLQNIQWLRKLNLYGQ